MAKKRESSIEDAASIFKDVVTRLALTDYFHINRVLFSKNDNGNTILLSLDQNLWNSIIDDPDFKDKICELDITKESSQPTLKICSYSDETTSTWVDLDCDLLYAGKVVKIKIDNLEYELSVNKNLIPLKLKKSEFNNISYCVFPNMTLAIKKRFDYDLDDCGFSIIRLFQIV